MTRKAKKKIKLRVSSRLFKKRERRLGAGSKHCRFCSNPEQALSIDYKNAGFLKYFLTERGKILPSRISGNCCYHQRQLSGELKLSRTMALLPYCSARY